MRGGDLSSQVQALEFLYNTTQGNQWRWKNEALYGPKWSFTSPQVDPCNDNKKVWQGITCSTTPDICKLQSCEIVSLTLDGYNLNGTLPSEFFIAMSSMTYLEIASSSDLVGTIPSEIGSLSQLISLFIYSTRLTGSLPLEIGSLSELVSFFLFLNQFTGTIPSVIGSLSQLGSLYLSSNQLTGSLPSEIGSLSELGIFYLDNNQLTGTIPITFGALSELSVLSLPRNQFTGTIPSQLSSLSELSALYLHKNQFTGMIPSAIACLSQLDVLSLYDNHLTGTIPSEIASSSQLSTLYLYNNYLTGTISPNIGCLFRLVSLSLHNNQLTGTLPPEIGSLSHLVSLYGYGNQLTGPIPLEIGFLSQLVSLYLHLNQLTGSIPSEIGSLSQLGSLYLDNNLFTGTIPSEIGSFLQLETISLFNNQFTGTLPLSISRLRNLTWLHAYDNHLSGQITFPLALLPKLEQLFLHRNHFTGHLYHLVRFSPDSPWNVSSSELLNLDVSDNLFSGSIPSTLFLPHLQSISLSLNCFEHELPSSICEASDAGVISMDGLGSAKGCKSVVTVPFTSVSLVQSLDGNIPDCVWSMSNLKMLNLAGNGLRGRIGAAASMSSLLSLTLSHNYLSGEIPLWLQTKNLSHLDLSHNKLTGDVNGFRHQNVLDSSNSWNSDLVNASLGSQYLNRSLALTVNRLSGDLPDSFGKYSDLDILSGNLFGCVNLPKNDENSDSVSCGSEEYDQTLQLMGGVLGSIVCGVVLLYLLRLLIPSLISRDEKNDSKDHRFASVRSSPVHSIILRSLNYDQSISSSWPHPTEEIKTLSPLHPLPSTISFGNLLSRLIRSVCVLSVLCLLFTLPIYVLKQWDAESGDEGDPQYVTHSHMYNWLWTMAFVSGATPAIIFLLMCLVTLFYFVFVVNRLGAVADIKEPHSSSSSVTDNDPHHLHPFTIWIIFVLNVVVVGTVNGLYLWSTLLDLSSDVRMWVQFSFGLFSFLWSFVLRHGLPLKIKESESGVWLFTCLIVINSVIIPCIATSLSSPSCYQRLLIPPDNISSSYSYQSCVLLLSGPNGNSICVLSAPRIMAALEITSPFFYSYQCGSTLITSYIPVYMYSVSLQFLSTILICAFIILSSSHNITEHPHWSWLLNWFPGVCWPSHWNNFHHDQHTSELTVNEKPIRLVKPHEIISRMMNNLVLLLSFGVCSPVLCCYIALSICVHLSCWLILIGRFVCLRIDALAAGSGHKRITEDQLLLLLDQQLSGVHSALLVCKWPIILTSCFFVTLLCWEMAGDQGGWFSALWVPIVGVVMAMLIWVWDRVLISDATAKRDWLQRFFSFLPSSRLPNNNCHSEPTISLEIVHSSLHQPPLPATHETPEACIHEEVSGVNLKSHPLVHFGDA